MPPSTPRHRGRSRRDQTQRTPHRQEPETQTETPRSIKKPTNGLYQDGRWWCNCRPRKPCAYLQTKKKGPNKDKWFYRCQSSQSCDFFIWEDQARLREGEPVEREDLPRQPEDSEPFKQRRITSFGISVTPRSQAPQSSNSEDDNDSESASDSNAAVASTPCPPSNKRKRNALQDEEEFDFGEMTPEEERQMAALADLHSSSRPQHGRGEPAPPPGVSITPEITSTTDRIGGLPTPSVARTLWPSASTRSSKRQKTVSFEDRPDDSTAPQTTPITASTSSTATVANSGSPTKSNTTTAQASSNTDSPGTTLTTPSNARDDTDVTTQVMTLLESQQNIDPGVLSSVRSILETSARKTKGLALSRDATRSIMRDKDLKIGKQQERITNLENKDRLSQKQISTMKANLMNIYQDN